LNKEAKAVRKHKSKMWKTYGESRAYTNLVEYKQAQNKLVTEHRKAKKLEKRACDEKKLKCFMHKRSKTEVKDVVVGLPLNSGGNYVSENKVMCNILNDYFGSVFTEENDALILLEVVNKFTEDSNHMLRRMKLTEDANRNRLRKLKVNKASGIHNIVPRLLVENAVS
jgi:hypothetical protein